MLIELYLVSRWALIARLFEVDAYIPGQAKQRQDFFFSLFGELFIRLSGREKRFSGMEKEPWWRHTGLHTGSLAAGYVLLI